MKKSMNSLAESVPDVSIKKGLFSTKVFIHDKELKHNTIYFGPDYSSFVTEYTSKKNPEVLEKLKPIGNGPNKIESFIADDNSVVAFRLYQYVPHSYEPRTDWLVMTDNRTCLALRKLISNIK
ncbi:MAG: hypothetical protein ACOX32_06425 [Bacteroidaceae bacterium]|jgi:hypothetical protein|nr:hypothetical protein [Bacteroidaceae bacterium]HOD69083.1 hypothetical protein [Bacteroidaceae bacterium]HPB04075.1 hypothetical protein [Bacteroidaceae bacterium]HQL26041.1 hypothetical protein [Bacteroidaceae bacterium]